MTEPDELSGSTLLGRRGPSRASRVLAAAVTAGVFALAALAGTRLSVEQNLVLLLPDGDPVIQGLHKLLTRFRAVDTLVLDVEALDSTAAGLRQAEDAADTLRARLIGSGMFAWIEDGSDRESLGRLAEALVERLPLLIEPEDLDRALVSLDSTGVAERLEAVRRTLLEPGGLFAKQRLEKDPLGLLDVVLGRLATSEARLERGRVFSPSGRDMLILGVPRAPPSDAGTAARVVALVEECQRDLETSAVRIHAASGYIASFANARAIRGDVERSLAVTGLGIAILGGLVLRRRIAIILIFLPAAFGAAIAVTISGLVLPGISAIAVGCGAALVGIAVDYGIHVIVDLDDPEGSVKRLRIPVLAGAATTALGFAVLLFASIPGQRQMGFFAVLGVVGAAGFALVLLPRLIGPAKSGRPWVAFFALAERLVSWRDKTRWLTGFGLVLCAASAFGITRLRFEGDLERFSFLGERQRADERHIHEVWGSFARSAVIVEGEGLEEALVRNEAVAGSLAAEQLDGRLIGMTSIAGWLPSRKRQDERWRSWQDLWQSERGQAVLARMEHEQLRLRFSGRAFAPFLDTLSERPLAVVPAIYIATLVGRMLDGHLASTTPANVGESAAVSVLTSFRLRDRSDFGRVRQELGRALPFAEAIDRRFAVEHTVGLVQGDLLRLGLIAGTLVLACLLVCYRKVELAILAFLPVSVAIGMTLGLLGLFGSGLDLMGSLFVVFVFGVGVDYSVFLTSSRIEVFRAQGCPVHRTWGSVLLCAATTILGFAAMAAAEHPALFSLGLTGTLGIAASLFAAFWLLPPLSRRLLPEDSPAGAPGLRNILGAVYAFAFLVGFAVLWRLVLRYVVRVVVRNEDGRRSLARRYGRWVNRSAILRFPYLASGVDFVGVEASRLAKPAVIVCNHVSPFDVVLVQTLPCDFVMLVKRWVWDAPLLGTLVRDRGDILVERGADEVRKDALLALARGTSVLVFPEGSRSPDGRMRRFHKGAFEIARAAACDVLPVVLGDSQSCIPRRAWWIGDFRTVVEALPTVATLDFAGRPCKEFADAVRDTMAAALPRIWRAAQRGRVFWRNIRALYRYRGPIEGRVGRRIARDPLCQAIDDLVPLAGTVAVRSGSDGLIAAILARKSLERAVLEIAPDPETAIARCRILRGLANIEVLRRPRECACLVIDGPSPDTLAPEELLSAVEPGGLLILRGDGIEIPPGWTAEGSAAAGVQLFRRIRNT